MKFLITTTLFTLNLICVYGNTTNKTNRINQSTKKSDISFTDLPCYIISNEGGSSPNSILEYNPNANSWQTTLLNGATNIEAMAIDQNNEIVYATDGGTFGVIDINNEMFSPIGEVGFGNGEFGQIDLNNIDGLAYDNFNKIMYATHRISGFGDRTNDLLLQIDIATGKLVNNAMKDENDNPVDYAVIEEIHNPYYGGSIYDVEDIAWDTYAHKLYALYSQNSTGAVAELDIYTGELNTIIYDLDQEILGGISKSYLGGLLVTTQSNSGDLCISNPAFSNWLGGSNPFCYNDQKVEAFDCYTYMNDLALTMELDPSIQGRPSPGDEVTYLITIYNEGELDNIDVTIVKYGENGLTLSDTDWLELDNGDAEFTITELLSAGSSVNIPVTYTINADFKGGFIINTAEIASSYNPGIFDLNGDPIPLPDIDSNPDDIHGNDSNNEDDTDIYANNVKQINNLPYSLNNIQPETCNVPGAVTIQLLQGAIPPFHYKVESNTGEIVHNQNTYNELYQISGLKAGEYNVTIVDGIDIIHKRATFSIIIPFEAPLTGNTNCNNACPEYVVVPDGPISGTFLAKQEIEIKNYVSGVNNTLFDICEQ